MSPTSIEIRSACLLLQRPGGASRLNLARHPWLVRSGSDSLSQSMLRSPSTPPAGPPGRCGPIDHGAATAWLPSCSAEPQWLTTIRPVVLGALILLMTACGSAGPRPEKGATVETGPAPALVADYQQALRQLEDGDEAGAQARLQALAGEHAEYSGPLVNLALIHARRGELDEAGALLERAVAVCTRCAEAWNELGVVQRRQGRFDEAERSYLAALTADPGYGNAHFNLGVLYELYLRRPALALDQYTRYLGLHAESPEAADVEKWMADLKRRVGTVERSARLEEPT